MNNVLGKFKPCLESCISLKIICSIHIWNKLGHLGQTLFGSYDSANGPFLTIKEGKGEGKGEVQA